jgi:O-antigen ligase/tetratricopeptide (TPR) repeat protein
MHDSFDRIQADCVYTRRARRYYYSGMNNDRVDNSKADSIFLFLILLCSPLFVVPALGGSAQFGTARQALIVALASLWALAAIIKRGPSGVSPAARGGVVFLIFVIWVAAAGYFAHPVGGTAKHWLYFALFFLIFILTSNTPDKARIRRAAEAAVIAAGIIVTVYGYLHFFRIFRIAQSVDWGQRTASLFEDPNYFGIYMLFPIYWSLSKALASAGRARGLLFAAAAVCVTGLFISNSRSAWFSFGISLPVFAIAEWRSAGGGDVAKRRIKAIAAFFVFIAAFGILAGRLPAMKRQAFDPVGRVRSALTFFKSENQVRTQIHAVAMLMIRERPWFGEGNFAVESQRVQAEMYHKRGLTATMHMKQPQHAYNDYLTLASVSGLPALVLYILLLMLALSVLWKHASRPGGTEAVACAPGYLAAAFAFIIQGTGFQSPLFCVVATAHFWVTVGLAAPGPPAVRRGVGAGVGLRFVGAAAAVVLLAFFAYFLGLVPVMGQYHYYNALYCRDTGCYERGLKQAEAAIGYMPGNPYARIVKADLEMSVNDKDAAIVDYLEARRLGPYDTLLLQSVGLCYAKRGEWGRAAEMFREAIRWEPGNPTEILPYLAAAVLGSGDAKGAVGILEGGVAEYPANPGLHYALAGAYLAAGRPQDAYIEASQSVGLEPENPIRYVRLARTLIVIGRVGEARSALLAALRIAPNNESARLLLGGITKPSSPNANSGFGTK